LICINILFLLFWTKIPLSILAHHFMFSLCDMFYLCLALFIALHFMPLQLLVAHCIFQIHLYTFRFTVNVFLMLWFCVMYFYLFFFVC
jgi:hypothetical protein